MITRSAATACEDALRCFLSCQDKEWLIDQLVRLALHSRPSVPAEPPQEDCRTERTARLRSMELDCGKLIAFLDAHRSANRESLLAQDYLCPTAPPKGAGLIAIEHRTADGNRLLTEAKDILFALLFGDEATNTRFQRNQRELLTLTLPRSKAHVLDFMKAATELSALGTWQDPETVSNDMRAANVVLEVEYGEVEDEWIGQGIVCVLSLINNLEVNEQILYARMIDIEHSTLIQ